MISHYLCTLTILLLLLSFSCNSVPKLQGPWWLYSPQDPIFSSRLNPLRQLPVTPACAAGRSGACPIGEPPPGGSLPYPACVLPSAPSPTLAESKVKTPCHLASLLGSKLVTELTTIFQSFQMHDLLCGFCCLLFLQILLTKWWSCKPSQWATLDTEL